MAQALTKLIKNPPEAATQTNPTQPYIYHLLSTPTRVVIGAALIYLHVLGMLN